VKVKVIRSGVGAITESDVLLGSATQAGSSSSAVVIIGFNVRPEARAADVAKQESVDIRLHSIIYKVEEEIRAAMIGMLEGDREGENPRQGCGQRSVPRSARGHSRRLHGHRWHGASQCACAPDSRWRGVVGRQHRFPAPVQG
jgi:translation initiation factor IF-2